MEIGAGLEQLYFTTCLVRGQGVKTDGAPVSWTGTAFVYAVSVDGPGGDGSVHVLVSNKHVLSPAKVYDIKITISSVRRSKGGSLRTASHSRRRFRSTT